MNLATSHFTAGARAEIYRSLAECYHPPAAATAARVRGLGRHLKSVCPRASGAADRMEAALLGYETPHDLSVDHARLFVGPFALLAPPYGSVYLDGDRQVMSASTLDAAARFREAGLDLAPGFAGTPDHIAAELEFMYFLIFKEREALTTGDHDRAHRFRGMQNAFLLEHLATWVPRFTRETETQAQTRFYQNLAAATRFWIEAEAEQVTGAAVASDNARGSHQGDSA